MKLRLGFYPTLLATLCALQAWAISPAQLQQLIARGEKITIIDARSNVEFAKSHIPGAINIPADLCAQKKLPPLGRVIVYSTGLGPDAAVQAAAELNKKSGIQAEILDGGFSGWENLGAESTASAGMKAEELPFVTYQQLKETPADRVVLVDLRKAPQRLNSTTPAAPLTDLAKEFPGAPVTRSPFQLPRTRQAAGSAPPLLVLIDNGDGSAQEMARALKANGVRRMAILAGGESILARKGKPGLQRQGPGQGVAEPVRSTPPSPR